MINFTSLKNFDLKQLDPTKIDLTKFDVRNFDMPKFDMPKFDMPKFDMPKFDMPVDKADFEKMAELARDAAYIGLGAAVVAVKKVDEQRRELTDQVTTQVRQLIDAVA